MPGVPGAGRRTSVAECPGRFVRESPGRIVPSFGPTGRLVGSGWRIPAPGRFGDITRPDPLPGRSRPDSGERVRPGCTASGLLIFRPESTEAAPRPEILRPDDRPPLETAERRNVLPERLPVELPNERRLDRLVFDENDPLRELIRARDPEDDFADDEPDRTALPPRRLPPEKDRLRSAATELTDAAAKTATSKPISSLRDVFMDLTFHGGSEESATNHTSTNGAARSCYRKSVTIFAHRLPARTGVRRLPVSAISGPCGDAYPGVRGSQRTTGRERRRTSRAFGCRTLENTQSCRFAESHAPPESSSERPFFRIRAPQHPSSDAA